MICSMVCTFAVDISSFDFEEQKDLHCSNMVQGSSILSCKWRFHLVDKKKPLIFWESDFKKWVVKVIVYWAGMGSQPPDLNASFDVNMDNVHYQVMMSLLMTQQLMSSCVPCFYVIIKIIFKFCVIGTRALCLSLTISWFFFSF